VQFFLAQDIVSLLGISAGISAVIGGSVSAIINYLMTMRQFKKQSQASLIEQRLEVYSYVIYQIDKMKFTYDALSFKDGEQKSERERYAYTDVDWNNTVEAVDNKLQDKYHLINYKVLELWTWVKTLQPQNHAIYKMRELRKELVREYEKIREQHVRIVGSGVQPIPLASE
jgi:hypothetical protein